MTLKGLITYQPLNWSLPLGSPPVSPAPPLPWNDSESKSKSTVPACNSTGCPLLTACSAGPQPPAGSRGLPPHRLPQSQGGSRCHLRCQAPALLFQLCEMPFPAGTPVTLPPTSPFAVKCPQYSQADISAAYFQKY